MSKITLTDVVNLQNENTAVNAINTNSDIIELAFDNTLSRDGTSPNQMEAGLDMNSNRILNLPTPVSNYEPIRLIDVDTINAGGITVSPLPAAGTTNQILGKVSSANFDVSWRDNHPVIAGGATGQVLAKSSGTDYALTWANGSTVAAGDGIDITPGSPSIINLRDYKSIKDYGAVGDGIHDDAPAIRAAIADMVSGEVLYIPPTNPGYLLNSVVNGAALTLDNRSISLWGGGWQLKNEGTYANVRGSVFIVGSSIGDNDDIIHWKGTDVVFGASFKNFAICGASNAYGGDHGRNMIFIDAPTLTGDDFYLTSFTADNLFLCNGKTGYSFKTFADQVTNHGGGALSWSTISNSDMMNIRLEAIGDSVTIKGCTLGANALTNIRNCGVYFYNGQGVTSTRIINNVFNNESGCIICDGGTSPVIFGNEFEENNPAVNLHGSMVDLNGGIGNVIGAYVAGNTIGQNSLVASYIPLRIHNASGTYVSGNRISNRVSGHITVTSSAQNTFIGHGIYLSGPTGVDLGLSLSDAGFLTSVQTVFSLSLAGQTSGFTNLKSSTVASGILTIPAATDTLVGKATTDIFTNKTFDTAGTGNSFSINSLAATANTGTGAVVRATSPTLVTPALGTPSALVGTNITGTAAGLTAGSVTTNANLTGVVTSVGNATSLGSFSSANLATALTDETGSGANVFANTPTLVTPVLGAATGTSLNLSGLTASSAVATDGSKNLVSVTNTGSGSNVLATSPTLVTPALGTPTALVLSAATGLPLTTGVTGTLGTANGGTGNTAGAWTSYSPTTGTTTGTITAVGNYYNIGKTYFVCINMTWTSAVTGTATVTLPTNANRAFSVYGNHLTSGTGVTGWVLGASNTVSLLFSSGTQITTNGSNVLLTVIYESV